MVPQRTPAVVFRLFDYTSPNGIKVYVGQHVHPDRGREGFPLPSLRTVRAVFPHTALQSVVSSSGLARQNMRSFHGEKPVLSEKGIGPAFMIDKIPTGSFASFHLLAQY